MRVKKTSPIGQLRHAFLLDVENGDWLVHVYGSNQVLGLSEMLELVWEGRYPGYREAELEFRRIVTGEALQPHWIDRTVS